MNPRRKDPGESARTPGAWPTNLLELMNMAERSAAAPHWVVVILVLRGLTRLIPPTGIGRRRPPPTHTALIREDPTDLADWTVPVPAARWQPYSTGQGPLDGSASQLSRPYLCSLAYPAPRAHDRAVTR